MKTAAVRVRQADDGRTFLQLLAPDQSLLDRAVMRVTIEDERSYEQHNLFWKMCRFVSENSDQWASAEKVLEWLKIQMGLYKVIEMSVGKFLHLESISFRAMGARKFKRFMDDSVRLLSEHAGFDPLAFYEESQNGEGEAKES